MVIRARHAGGMMAALGLAVGVSAAAAEPPTMFTPNDFQSFLLPWPDAPAPLCAVLVSPADWEKRFHPAPTIPGTRPFAPPDSFWRDHALVLIARRLPGGEASGIFTDPAVTRTAGTLRLAITFHPPQPSSWTMNGFVAVAVAKPVPQDVQIFENGDRICGGKQAVLF